MITYRKFNVSLFTLQVLSIFIYSGCQQNTGQSITAVADAHLPFTKLDTTISIILMDGTKADLHNHQNGLIARQGGIRIEQKASGEIVYTQEYPNPKGLDMRGFNEIRVPRKRAVWVRLYDGSRLCLNANSSFRFPLFFPKNHRETSISGEAYFQIPHNNDKPFIVVANGDSIVTQEANFNCESYADRALNEIALEIGSIRITHHNKRVTPKEGQIVSISKNGEFKLVQRDILEVTSYKDGYLFFPRTNLPRIISEAECWYGVKIIPKEPVDESLYYHLEKHPLSDSLPLLLERLLNLKDLHFEIRTE